ncbi:MAG: diacylglycerol kinase family lipid kinase [Cyclobacteriaceae bacterium]|nr:diacylglycerol kinase family lipid kinase [Cyclobacteriaceae bacterium]
MTQKRYFILVNPVAGNGKSLDKIDRIREEFSRREVAFDLYETNGNARANIIIRNRFHPGLYSDILILGGDGTINETLNGLKYRDVPLSVISMGTGNDTIKHIHKKLDFDYQLKTAIEGIPVRIDAGLCNDKVFLNGVGIGFDGKVVELLDRTGKKPEGHRAYMHAVLKILLTYREKEILAHYDGGEIREKIFLMTITKGTTFGGGFLVNPFAKNDDGLLDICLFKKTPLWMRIFYLPRMKNGGHAKLDVVSFFKSKKVNIEKSEHLVAHMDGEFIGHPPFAISVMPSAFLFRI